MTREGHLCLGILGLFFYQAGIGSRRSTGIHHHLNPAVWVHISVDSGQCPVANTHTQNIACWQRTLWEGRPKNLPASPDGTLGWSRHLGGVSLTGFSQVRAQDEGFGLAGLKIALPG